MIEVEVTHEIWRTSEATFEVIYPLPHIAYIKGFRGSFNRKLRENIHQCFKDKGVKEVYYERRKPHGYYTIKADV